MIAARVNADGVAKLLIEAGADLHATVWVRPVGVHACMHADLTHLHHHHRDDCRRYRVRVMDGRR